MKKSLSIVLLAAMLVTLFSGCSLFGDNIVGKWEAEIDITEYIKDGISEALGEDAASFADVLEFKDLKFNLIATFNDDGSYEIAVSQESVKNAMNSFVDQTIAVLKTVYMKEAEKVGATEDVVNTAIEQVSAQIKSIITEESVAETAEPFTSKGFYKLSDGKLYTAKNVEALESAGYETYELKDDTLTLNKGEGLEEVYSELISDFYPITYKKVVE